MINSRNSFYFVLGLILIAAFSRIIPHYPNFTPLCAIALFGAKYFRNRNLAFLIPIVALWFSDVIINNFILSQYFENIMPLNLKNDHFHILHLLLHRKNYSLQDMR